MLRLRPKTLRCARGLLARGARMASAASSETPKPPYTTSTSTSTTDTPKPAGHNKTYTQKARDVLAPDSPQMLQLEKLAEEHNGFLFGEIPPPAGQQRVKETWEYYFPQMMWGGMLLFGIIQMNKPYINMDEWAREEALRRNAELDAEIDWSQTTSRNRPVAARSLARAEG